MLSIKTQRVSHLHLTTKVFPYILKRVKEHLTRMGKNIDEIEPAEFIAVHTEAIVKYNEEFGTIHSWRELFTAYQKWLEREELINGRV